MSEKSRVGVERVERVESGESGERRRTEDSTLKSEVESAEALVSVATVTS